MRRSLRILHTSDVHVVDTDFSIALVRAIVEVARQEQVDLVVIAGDLFDNPRILDATAGRVIAELARLEQPAVIIPGNHDCIDKESLYRRVDLTRAGSQIHFVSDPDGTELIFEGLSLAVWARGIEEHSPAHRPLSSFRPSDDRYWRVAVAHGLHVPAGLSSVRSSQIHEEEIAALACDYLALGHVHSFLDLSAGQVTATYSGSPSTGVNLVDFDPDLGVRVSRRGLHEPAVDVIGAARGPA